MSGFDRQELQTICDLLDRKAITLSVAKSRAFAYLGIEVKGRSVEQWTRNLCKAFAEREKSIN